MMRALVLGLAVLAGGGCIGHAQPSEVPAHELDGIVEGVVLEEVGLPIEGAEVGLLDVDNMTTVSGPDGRFKIAGATPGSHELVAFKSGYQGVRRMVNLSQGRPLEVQITLVPAAHPVAPRLEVLEGRGFLACGLALEGLATIVAQACASDTNHKPLHPFDVDVRGGLLSIVVEMAWRPGTSNTGQELRLGLWKNGACGTQCTFEHDYNVYASGASPLRIGMGDASAPFSEALEPDRPTRLTAVALPEYASATEPRLVWQQPVDFYVSVFYHQEPPPDYTAVPSGNPD